MLLATVAMTSCSKSSSSTPTLVGKWKFVSYVSKEGSNTTNNITGTSADYLDFKSNGTLESFISGQTSNTAYTISGSNVSFDGQTYTVSLASTTATLSYTGYVGSLRIEEIINLKK